MQSEGYLLPLVIGELAYVDLKFTNHKLFVQCRQYMIPEGYVLPLVDGDLAYVDLPQGILFVRLIEAVNVPKTDWLGRCDPYVA